MLSNVGEIITEVLVRSNRTTTDSFITDAMLQDWVRMSVNWAYAFRRWPFSEGRASTTFAGSEEMAYFEGWKQDSVRFLQIGGKRHQKLNFEDYQIFREKTPSANDRVYAEFSRVVYVNPNTDASGTLVAYGQYTPTIDPTDYDAETLFSSRDQDGNDAIVDKMIGYLRSREHAPDEAMLQEQKAAAKLEGVWQKIEAEAFAYQGKNRGIFERFDIMSGAPVEDGTNTNQF